MALIRFEQEQKEWADWEAKAKAKYGKETIESMPFRKDYLAHLEGIEIKYGKDASLAERRELRVLRAKRREVEKLLFPGLLFRISYRIFQAVIISKMKKQLQVTQGTNIEALRTMLAERGFSNISNQVEKQVKNGLSEFNIIVAYQMNEQAGMRYQLQFQKENGGTYHVKEIMATLKDEADGKSHSMLFSSIPDNDLTTKQAYNLLAGRAIEKKDGWVSLDVNDRDAQGNLKIKVFPAEYGFSLECLLAKSNIQGIDDFSFRDRMLKGLRSGDVLKVKSGRREIEVEATPRHNSLQKPATIVALREKEKQASLSVEMQTEKSLVVSKAKMKVS
jgi:hypothetical protein